MRRPRLITIVLLGVSLAGAFVAAVLPVVAAVLSLAGFAAAAQAGATFFAAKKRVKRD